MTYQAFGVQLGTLWLCSDTACNGVIVDGLTWLGEHEPEPPRAYPFHATCANGPWPLYPVDASEVTREKAEAAP